MENPNQRAQRSVNEQQTRHEALIDTMNQFLQYQDKDGNKMLRKRDHQIGSGDLVNLSVNEINKGAVILTDFFNMSGGSSGDMDLYKLLQAYFLDIQTRKEINKLLGYF